MATMEAILEVALNTEPRKLPIAIIGHTCQRLSQIYEHDPEMRHSKTVYTEVHEAIHGVGRAYYVYDKSRSEKEQALNYNLNMEIFL